MEHIFKNNTLDSKSWKRLPIHVIFLLVALCLSGCGKSKDSKESQTLRMNIALEPPILDTRRATDTTSGTVLALIYDQLTRTGKDGSPEPSTAESIAVSEDLKTYTFKLRDSFWTNGDPVTAHDFVYAWKWILNPKNPADQANLLYVIKNAKEVKEGTLPVDDVGIKAIDDKTLVVELVNPTPYFLELATFSLFSPFNKKMDADGYPKETFISNGPFQLTSWKHDSEIILEKSPTYWDKDSIKLQKIHLLMVGDIGTELHMFEAGELDFAGMTSLGLPLDSLEDLKKSGQLHTAQAGATYFYLLNTGKAPLTNVKLRKALSYAINRKAIVDNITHGVHTPATSIVPPFFTFPKDPYFQDNNVEEAKKLFQEALDELGMKPEDFPTLTLSYNSSTNHAQIAQAVQQQLKAVLGINIVLESADWKVHLEKIKGRTYDIARLAYYAGFKDPTQHLDLFMYKTNRSNPDWENPEYQRLLNAASKEVDQKKRLELLYQAEKLFIDDMPLIPIYTVENAYLINPKLRDIILTPLGGVDFTQAYLED